MLHPLQEHHGQVTQQSQVVLTQAAHRPVRMHHPSEGSTVHHCGNKEGARRVLRCTSPGSPVIMTMLALAKVREPHREGARGDALATTSELHTAGVAVLQCINEVAKLGDVLLGRNGLVLAYARERLRPPWLVAQLRVRCRAVVVVVCVWGRVKLRRAHHGRKNRRRSQRPTQISSKLLPHPSRPSHNGEARG